MPFTVLREVSDMIIFGIVSIPLITVLEKLSGGESIGVSEK